MLSWHVADDDGPRPRRSLFVEDVCDLFEEDLLERPRAARCPGHGTGGRRSAVATAAARATGSARCSDERVLAELRRRVRGRRAQLENCIGCPVRWFVERMLRPRALGPRRRAAAPRRARPRGAEGHARGAAERTGSAARDARHARAARELLRAGAGRARARAPAVGVAPSACPARGCGCAPTSSATSSTPRGSEPAGAGPARARPSAFRRRTRRRARQLPGLRARRRRRCCAGASTASTVARRRRGRGRLQEPAPRRRRRGGSATARSRSRCTCCAVEQLLGVRAVGGFYQPLSGGDLRARGVLDEDSGVELDCVARRRAARAQQVRELLRRGARDGAARRPPQARARRARARPDELLLAGRLQLSRRSAGAQREPRRSRRRGLTAERSRRSPRASRCRCRLPPGSGKTSVLVERFVAAVREDGIAPRRSSRSRSPSAPPASCASACVRASSSSASGRAARDTEAAFVSHVPRLLRAPAAPPTRWPRAWTPASRVLDEGVAGRLRDARLPDGAAGASCARRARRRGGAGGRLRSRPRCARWSSRSTPSCAAAASACRGSRARARAARRADADDREAAAACVLLDELLDGFSARLRGAQARARGGRLRRPRAAGARAARRARRRPQMRGRSASSC